MSPIDMATKRRDRDREEIERCKHADDIWGAFDVVAANVHELEGREARTAASVDAMRGAVDRNTLETSRLGAAWADAMVKIGDAVIALETAKSEAQAARRAADDSRQQSIVAGERAAEAIIARAATAAQLSVSEDARRSLGDLNVEEKRAEHGARLSVWWRRNRWPLTATIAGLVVSGTIGALVTWLLTRR